MSGFSRRLLQAVPNTVVVDSEIGVPGNRPAMLAKPTDTNTGPRASYTQTMTGAQAMSAVMSAPVEGDGKRYLRRTLINGGLVFNAANQSDLVFEDCTIDSQFGIIYAVSGWYNSGGVTGPSGGWPELRFCEIKNANSTTAIGQKVRYIRCNLHHAPDTSKPFGDGGEFYACYMHDNWRPVGAHCDSVQIVNGASNLLIHWNNMRCFASADSPESPGTQGSGVLQTGTMTGNVGPVQWFDNWFDGGGYSIRVAEGASTGGYAMSYEFRRNKFGRGATFGPTANIPAPGVFFDNTNVWEDNGQPVL